MFQKPHNRTLKLDLGIRKKKTLSSSKGLVVMLGVAFLAVGVIGAFSAETFATRLNYNWGDKKPLVSVEDVTNVFANCTGSQYLGADGACHDYIPGLWTTDGSDIYVNAGNVGIGDTDPDGTLMLDVEGQVGATEYCDENGANCKTILALSAEGVPYAGATGDVDLGVYNLLTTGEVDGVDVSDLSVIATTNTDNSDTNAVNIMDIYSKLSGNLGTIEEISTQGVLQANVTGDVFGSMILADGVSAITQTTGDNSTKVATTEYVDGALTGVTGDTIIEGNTTVETIDAGTDGIIVFETEGVEAMRIDEVGNVGIGNVSPTVPLDVSGASSFNGDMTVEGELTSTTFKSNNIAIYSPDITENLLNIRRYGADHTVLNLMSPPQTSWGGAKEATLALVRGDANEYYVDLYNMDYGDSPTGNNLDSGDPVMGLRLQKRGTGVYTPFHFEYASSVSDVQKIMSFYPNDTATGINDSSVTVHKTMQVKEGIAVGDIDSVPDTGLLLDVEGQIGASGYCDKDGLSCKTIAELSSDVWEKSGSNVYYESGNVGIGTNDPETQFHMKSTGAAYMRLQGVSDGDNVAALELWNEDVSPKKWQMAHNSNGDFKFSHNNGVSWGSPFRIKDNNDVVISNNMILGGDSPEAKLHLVADADETLGVGITVCSAGYTWTVDENHDGILNAGDKCSKGALMVEGNILPEMTGATEDVASSGEFYVSNRTLGGPDNWFKALYVQDLHLGQNTLYMNGEPVLSNDSAQLEFSATSGQDMIVSTQGINGELSLNSESTISTNVAGTNSGKNINLTNESANGNILLAANGVNAQVQMSAVDEIDLTAPVIDINGDLSLSVLRLPEQGSNPGIVDANGKLYSKNDGGITKLYFMNDIGGVTELGANTELDETAVDGFVANNGYLTSYTETDPVFTAWDKSTGVSITESQISDLQAYLLVESDPKVGTLTDTKWCTSNGSQVVCDTAAPSLDGVPYTGATDDLNLGSYNLSLTGTVDGVDVSALATSVTGKTAKVIPAVAGNLAGLDGMGSLIDSGISVVNENVGIGTNDPMPSDSNANTLQLGENVIIQNPQGTQLLLSENAYYDGTSWKYAEAGEASAVLMDGGDIKFNTANAGTAGGIIGGWDSTAIKMIIKSNGYIGIGKTAVFEKLDIDGNVKATAFIGDGSQLTGLPTGASSSGVAGAVQFSDGSGGFSATDTDLVWDNTNKRLGIGTDTPRSGLDVGDNDIYIGNHPTERKLYFGNATNYFTRGQIHTTATNLGLYNDYLTGYITLNTAVGEVVRVDEAGNVGIGDTVPDGTLKLDVEGQVGATGYCDAAGANCKTIVELAVSGIPYTGATGDLNLGSQDLVISGLVDGVDVSDLETSVLANTTNVLLNATVIESLTTTVETNDTAKADKVTSAVLGNLAGLDAAGNLTDSGVSVVNENVGIGTDNPTDSLHVKGATPIFKTEVTGRSDMGRWGQFNPGASYISQNLSYDGAWNRDNITYGATVFSYGDNTPFLVRYAQPGANPAILSTYLKVDEEGHVGIGTASPTESLEVIGNVKSRGFLVDDTTDARITLVDNSVPTSSWRIQNQNDTFKFIRDAGSGDEVAVYIDSGGALGIGDTAPDGSLKLDVEGQVGATGYCDESGANCKTIVELASSIITPSTDIALTAATSISPLNGIMRIVGSGGAVTLTSAPNIADGTDGQIVIIQGTSDTNLVTLQDKSVFSTSGLGLSGGYDFTLGKGDTLQLMYDAGDDMWYEITRSDN